MSVVAAEIVLPCRDLGATTEFFTRRLGFRLAAIFPADAPRTAVLVGHGLRLRFDRDAASAPGLIRLLCRDPRSLADGATSITAPDGTRIELVEAEPGLVLPPLRPSFVLTRLGDESSWGVGRAGMRYRDLVPDRQGGRFIASHIRIPEGGEVPDYVHFHAVRFQMIYCRKGWVRVVYEDQGPPFVMQAGDCVLQPPRIRHRVLEASPGLEVIEIGCPAEHETWADHGLGLPNATIAPTRAFDGQVFVRHVAAGAEWRPWRFPGFEFRDTGIEAATGGVAGARVVRSAVSDGATPEVMHDSEFLFFFVLDGAMSLCRDGHPPERLGAGDSVTIPARTPHAIAAASRDLELLEVSSPAKIAASS